MKIQQKKINKLVSVFYLFLVLIALPLDFAMAQELPPEPSRNIPITGEDAEASGVNLANPAPSNSNTVEVLAPENSTTSPKEENIDTKIQNTCGNPDFRKSLKDLKLDAIITYCRTPQNYSDCSLHAKALAEYDKNQEFIDAYSAGGFGGSFGEVYQDLRNGLDHYKAICDQKSQVFESTNPGKAELIGEGKPLSEPCLQLGEPNFTVCKGDTTVRSYLNDDEDRLQEFQALRNAIIDSQVITTLDEPIGRENLFTRAKVCRTQFVRNASGDLQPIGDSRDSTVFDPNNFEGLYAIEVTDCDNYIVTKCTPNFSNIRQLRLIKESDSKYIMADPKNPDLKYDRLPFAVYCDQIQVVYGEGGIDLLKKYVGFIYRLAASLIGIVAVLVIMVSGIQISMAQDGADQVDEAKNRITQALIAIGLLFTSGIILYAVNPTFFTTEDPQVPDVKVQEEPPKQETKS